MKCPDCGHELEKTVVVGLDDSYRCVNCGGVRLQGWVINQVAEGNEIKIPRISSEGVMTASGGSLRCPEDGSWLSTSKDADMPEGLGAWRCEKCNWWWLPGNNLFELADAFGIKREYMKKWHRREMVGSLVLPVIFSVVGILILGLGMYAVRLKTDSTMSRAAALTGKLFVYYVDGRAEIHFRSGENLQGVSFKRDGDTEWQAAVVVKKGEWQVLVIDGVSGGDKIWLSLGGEVRQITVGKNQ